MFINNVVFDESLNLRIVNLLTNELREGAKVICFSDFFPRRREHSKDPKMSRLHHPPFRFSGPANSASWTASPLDYFVYTVVPPCPSGALGPWLQQCNALAAESVDLSLAEEGSLAKRRKQKDNASNEQIAAKVSSLFMDLFVDGKARGSSIFFSLVYF